VGGGGGGGGGGGKGVGGGGGFWGWGGGGGEVDYAVMNSPELSREDGYDRSFEFDC